jgi:transcriptional regulator with XRE-family HTH domain
MNPEWFAGRLRELREAKGWTQQQLAEKANMTKDGLARLERGDRSPAWETVVALCQALGVDCSAFLTAPADREAPGPGRPKKADAQGEIGHVPISEDAGQAEAKGGRGAKKKGKRK